MGMDHHSLAKGKGGSGKDIMRSAAGPKDGLFLTHLSLCLAWNHNKSLGRSARPSWRFRVILEIPQNIEWIGMSNEKIAETYGYAYAF